MACWSESFGGPFFVDEIKWNRDSILIKDIK